MPQYKEYLGYICSVLESYNKKQIELSEATDIVADIGMTSLEVMESIEQIEDYFDISIPLNILPDVNTIGELARKVHELTQ